MSETKASMVRRAIVRADEDEVRRRVAKALPNASVRWSGDRVLIWGGVIGANCDADEEAALATVGIFHGRDGWEIEARRKLPAPWQWWNVSTGYAVIATSQIEADRANWLADVLDGHLNMFDKPHSQDTFLSVDCGNDVKARERAEDECWSRGLFGAVEDAPHAAPVAAPPVDRAQAIRDALVDALARGPMTDTSLRALLLARDLGTLTRDALVSVGAVSDGHTFRLSDGPPPGWQWRHDGCLTIKRLSDPTVHIANVYDDRRWNVYPQAPGHPSIAGGGPCDLDVVAQAAALLACRRAGLFAPPVATEPTDAHRDPAHEATVADLPNVPQSPVIGDNGASWTLARLLTENATHLPTSAAHAALLDFAEGIEDRVVAKMRGDLDVAVMQRKSPGATCADCVALSARLRAAEEALSDARSCERAWKATAKLREEERNSEMRGNHEAVAVADAMGERASKAETERDNAKLDASIAISGCAEARASRDRALAERDDTRAHCASWKRRAEDAEAMVVAMRALLDAPGKATP